jgi:ADP-ribose pyrophosphatase
MPFELLEKQVIFEGRRIRLEVHHLRNEETGKRHHREVVIHPGAVCVLPIRNDDVVVLIRQRRYSVSATLIEVPAGTLEKNEPPMNCAGRELLEETGYLAGRIVPIGSFFTSPGILTEKMYAFAAYDLEKRQAALEEGEEIELLEVPYEQAIEMVGAGQITDGKTIATLLMFARFHRRKG